MKVCVVSSRLPRTNESVSGSQGYSLKIPASRVRWKSAGTSFHRQRIFVVMHHFLTIVLLHDAVPMFCWTSPKGHPRERWCTGGGGGGGEGMPTMVG